MSVRGVPDAELPKDPYAHLSDEEFRAEMIASFCDAFPELRIVRRPALIEKSKRRVDACRHTAVLNASSYPAVSEVPSLGLGMRLGLAALGGSTICP
jgi:hypothetical protein